jgi:hypothetical protein
MVTTGVSIQRDTDTTANFTPVRLGVDAEQKAEGTNVLPFRKPSYTGELYSGAVKSDSITDWIKDASKPSKTETREASTRLTSIMTETPKDEFITNVFVNQPRLDIKAQHILRAHFAKQILADLVTIQGRSGQPTAAVYADSILRTIRQFRDLAPYDSYLEILMALYDAMAYENRWLEYSSTQYEDAHSILKSYANQQLDNSKVGKAITKLEELGFATIPFGVDLNFFESDTNIANG